ncbi:Chloride Intracellular Channel Protein 6 [Manis pentadactyla]|nr:Chloride Intracellular Channel Protein 6 [Manis pentadactyla]
MILYCKKKKVKLHGYEKLFRECVTKKKKGVTSCGWRVPPTELQKENMQTDFELKFFVFYADSFIRNVFNSGQPAFSKSEPARETGATPQELQRSPEDSGAEERKSRSN